MVLKKEINEKDYLKHGLELFDKTFLYRIGGRLKCRNCSKYFFSWSIFHR